MKLSPTNLIGLMAIGLAAIEFKFVSVASGAPPKSTPRSVSKSSSEEVSPEVPAVPFLTVGLIRDAAVHKELSLNPKQVAAVESAVAEVDEPLWRLRDVPVSKCADELDELLSKTRTSLKRELNASQLERFDQIVLQARSWKAIVTPEIASRLNLSNEQLSKLRKLLANVVRLREENEKKIAAEPAANQEAARARMQKAEAKRFTDVLSAKQQKQFGELLGEPFEMSRVMTVGCVAPELRDVTAWINSQPTALQDLRGKVVVVHFWAFGCINCIRNLPHYQGWQERYAKSGLTIIGIQTPETTAERSLENLKRQVSERKIEYPVVFDLDAKNWKAWGNDVWPAVYLIDKKGRVRNWWYGELNWNGAKGEEFFSKRIEALMAEE